MTKSFHVYMNPPINMLLYSKPFAIFLLATGSDGIPVRLLKDTADQSHCSDHVIQQIFAARHLYMRGSKPTWLVGVNLAE